MSSSSPSLTGRPFRLDDLNRILADQNGRSLPEEANAFFTEHMNLTSTSPLPTVALVTLALEKLDYQKDKRFVQLCLDLQATPKQSLWPLIIDDDDDDGDDNANNNANNDQAFLNSTVEGILWQACQDLAFHHKKHSMESKIMTNNPSVTPAGMEQWIRNKKKGRMPGAKAWAATETTTLLDCIQSIKPIELEEWDAVNAMCLEKDATWKRTSESCRNRFERLTFGGAGGHPIAKRYPELVARAAQVKELITAKRMSQMDRLDLASVRRKRASKKAAAASAASVDDDVDTDVADNDNPSANNKRKRRSRKRARGVGSAILNALDEDDTPASSNVFLAQALENLGRSQVLAAAKIDEAVTSVRAALETRSVLEARILERLETPPSLQQPLGVLTTMPIPAAVLAQQATAAVTNANAANNGMDNEQQQEQAAPLTEASQQTKPPAADTTTGVGGTSTNGNVSPKQMSDEDKSEKQRFIKLEADIADIKSTLGTILELLQKDGRTGD